ncbi:L-fucose/L-arabinose isomerase family protein [Breznakia pachnodae]|uniref:L-fucose isomerase-like protein n=1 Tax=Breznakia pachnodae TaxID=265178 RepID=A0ABU0E093_9FIRM|nr:L-fucose/L-arabinose isomerase family protein [Breznakia pachnodae]MDQ0360184.1 L-fucose isomerase-like protein [Breznakia pachnodae]
MKYNVKLGVIGTRRNIFSKDDAIKFNQLILKKLDELKVDYVDIMDVNEEGLLFDEQDVEVVIKKMKDQEVDALFFPHCNFGTEDLVAKVAKRLNLPVLLWGPRDESPLEDGSRLRDTQCGLFATGKILRRFQCKFTYLTSCELDDKRFEEGVYRFLATANIVKEMRGLTILQISTRPAGFWTMMVNEGELLERFDIRIHPIAFTEIKEEMKYQREHHQEEIKKTIQFIERHMIVNVNPEDVEGTACLKLAIAAIAKRYNCKAAAIQCWNALQSELGMFPCVANSLLGDEGFPVTCETDIHGAITSIIAQAASRADKLPFFADWTVPHPSNDNGELLQHCGPWPHSLMKTKPTFGAPFAFNHSHPGALHGELKGGNMSIIRFDGDNGEYKLLMGKAKGIEGPFNQGTYVWIEVENLRKLEDKLVSGPYVHHCVGIHEDILPQVYEACKYIDGLVPDLYDGNEEEIKSIIRGE